MSLPTVSADDFKADTYNRNDLLVLELVGTADLRVQPQLDEFLGKVNHLAQDRASREVVVDLRKLEFMNSSCFKAFVSWIGELQEMDARRQYKVRFLSEPRMLWQRRSLHALSCFAVDLITIETA
jgi:anti-anti-sigma factor